MTKKRDTTYHHAMDELVSVKEFKEQELRFLHTLKELSKQCQQYERSTVSALDPVTAVLDELKRVEKASIAILSKHIEYFGKFDIFCVISNVLGELFNDAELTSAYRQLLLSGAKVILNTNVTTFRSGDVSILSGIIETYNRMTMYEGFCDIANMSDGFLKMRQAISSFETLFFSMYKLLNENNLIFDKVYDALSHSNEMQPARKFNVIDISCHAPFKLTKTRFNEDAVLVDLAQLTTGELAIFKINSGRLPRVFKSSKDLLNALIEKDYDILKVGRTLMFKPLKPNDLRVVTFSGTTVELLTQTGNNVCLKLVCMNPMQWPIVWKPYFAKQFPSDGVSKQAPKRPSLINLKRESTGISHSAARQNLTSQLETSPLASRKAKSPTERTFLPSTQTDLLSSTNHDPIKRPTLPSEPSTCESQTSGPSLRDIESLSYDKLIELDNSIEMTLSPAPMPSPNMHQFRSESQSFSVDEIITNEQNSSPVVFGNDRHEAGDAESIMSSDSEDVPSVVRVSSNSIFNPSADTYKPSLQKPASNSLLSLFTNRSKPNLSIDTFNSENVSFFGSNNSSNTHTPLSSTHGDHGSPDVKTNVEIPNDIDLSDIIIEQDTLRVTRWSGKNWDKIGKGHILLAIARVPGQYNALVGYTNKQKTECAFIIKLHSDWKCFKSTAQDIQLKIPVANFVVSAYDLKENMETLTVRCTIVDTFMNSLLHCINGLVPVSLSSSSTIRTLSTTMSSYFSDSPDRSSTYQSYLSTGKNEYSSKEKTSLLLLAAVKVKRHERKEQKWIMRDLGSLDIISLEQQNVRVAAKFDFVRDSNNLENQSEKLEFCDELSKIKKLGRTGIFITDERADQLFEFTSHVVREQVYKLVQGI